MSRPDPQGPETGSSGDPATAPGPPADRSPGDVDQVPGGDVPGTALLGRRQVPLGNEQAQSPGMDPEFQRVLSSSASPSMPT